MPQLPVLNNVSPRTPHHGTPGGVSGHGGPAGDPALQRLAADLSALLEHGSGTGAMAGRGGEVRFGRHDRLLYSTDASLYQVEPLGVVCPASIVDAHRVVRFLGERSIPMLPRGGGTSLAGQCTSRAVVLDLTPHCRAIKHVDAGAALCEVEPGITIEDLNNTLVATKTGLFFAPDPATLRQCAVGGAIGNNAAGARSVLYGRTSENVHRLEVALATGERLWLGPGAGASDPVARRLGAGVLDIVRASARLIRERFPKTIRRNAGYALDMILDQAERGATPESVDLSKLLCGSEGTLAVTLGAILHLKPVPRAKGLAILGFDSVDAAIDAVIPILATGPSAVELLDDVVLEAARGNEECRRYLDIMPPSAGRPAQAILYVEYFGFDGGMDEVRARFASLRSTCHDRAATNSVREFTDAGPMNMAWALRKAGEPLLHGMPGPRKPITFVEDNAVPPERLAEFVREFRKIVTKHGTRAAYWAHASVGVLHVRPMIDVHDPADRERLRAIAVEVADLARACGGIMSGEHGDGRVRGPLIERFFGPELMRAFRDVKALFDPKALLNPGNIVHPGPIESITENLRVDHEHAVHAASPAQAGEGGRGSARPGGGASAHPAPIATFYDYADTEGFAHAAEQCNGAGVCRKRSGTMCPSFHATLDERHSTRGRGNALRLAITGQFNASAGLRSGEPNWDDDETCKTLDLCLSCKACKSECPSNVDIARLKAEYTAQRHRQKGRVPLAALATGHVRVLNRVGAATPGLANWFNSTPLARAVINRAMGIHPRRSLPPFSRSLYRAFTPQLRPAGTAKVVLYADCFTTYNESHIGLSAARVLESLGYEVALSPSVCCGRSMISVGMLAAAIESIDRAVEALHPAIEDPLVKAVVVCEPSCLSAIKDDWLGLKCRTPLDLRRRLAAKAALPEDFIDRHWDAHPERPDPARLAAAQQGPPVLLHAHCHQKALWGAETSARLLKRLAGPRLKVLDTGCCGMAGSFGYAAHRFDLSMKIAGLALLPAVREAPDGATVIAPGTSCRHQLHDAASHRALHPIEFAERILLG